MLPAIRPLIVFVLAIRLMDAFRFFDTIYVLTSGGPGTATETVTLYTYALAFRLLQIGKASALGVLTLLFVAILTGTDDPHRLSPRGRRLLMPRRLRTQLPLFLLLVRLHRGEPDADNLGHADLDQAAGRRILRAAEADLHPDVRVPLSGLGGKGLLALPDQQRGDLGLHRRHLGIGRHHGRLWPVAAALCAHRAACCSACWRCACSRTSCWRSRSSCWRKSLGLINTYPAMILALVAINQPFTIWLMRSFFVDVPHELYEAAAIDGCNAWQVFARVALPVVRPGLWVTALFSLLLAYNEFLFALVLTGPDTKTLPVAIAEYGGEDINYWSLSAAAAVGIMLPIVVFMMALQRHPGARLAFGAHQRADLGRLTSAPAPVDAEFSGRAGSSTTGPESGAAGVPDSPSTLSTARGPGCLLRPRDALAGTAMPRPAMHVMSVAHRADRPDRVTILRRCRGIVPGVPTGQDARVQGPPTTIDVPRSLHIGSRSSTAPAPAVCSVRPAGTRPSRRISAPRSEPPFR